MLGGAHRGDDDFTVSASMTARRASWSRSARPAPQIGPHGSALQPQGQGPTGNSTGEAHHAPSKIRAKFGDLTAREIAVVTPLALLIVFLGVYPQPVLDVINPTAERTMVDVGFTDPPPAIDAPIGGGR